MITDYIMIVNKRDAERFRRFRMGEDVYASRLIKQSVSAVNVWGLSARSCASTWSKIKCGDRIYFAEYGTQFVACGIVSDTVIDSQAAVSMWGDTARMRLLNHLILFSKVLKISEPFNQTCRITGVIPSEFVGLQETKRNIKITTSDFNSLIERASLPQYSVPITPDEDGPPGRTIRTTTRFDRDIEKTRQIKILYNGKCQVCGTVIVVPGPRRYSEVHHLRPLKNGGDDDYSNMLVLCPNHHVEFDHLTIGISADGATVIDRHGNVKGKITMAKDHVISPKNITYHREAMLTV